jgi:hypothetical protein
MVSRKEISGLANAYSSIAKYTLITNIYLFIHVGEVGMQY